MKVVILGAGGLGKVMLEALSAGKRHHPVGFLDDGAAGHFCDLPILGKLAHLSKLRGVHGVALALGDRFLRERLHLIRAIRCSSLAPIHVIHPTAWVSPSASLGNGVYVGPMACVHAATTVGDFAIIWSGSVIEHDNVVGENTFICPSVTTAGYTEIGRDVFVGLGAVLLRCKVGNNATVAAGSLVTRDVPDRALVMGVPSRKLRLKKTLIYR